MDGVDSRISPVGFDREYSRRNFLKTAAMAGAAAAAVGAGGLALGARPAWAVHEGYAAAGPLAVLQLAYKLELLEGTFYAEGINSGIFAGNSFAETQIAEIRDHEFAHADALAAAIVDNGGAVPETPMFTYPDGVFADPAAFLNLANTFEPVGIGAYQGAAPALIGSPLLGSALSIHNAECQHWNAIKILNGVVPPNNVAFEEALPLEAVLEAVAPFGVTA
jgi:hypothetical protein